MGFLVFCISQTSQAQSTNRYNPYSMPGGYPQAQFQNMYGYGNPSFGGGSAPFIGENVSNEAAIINCRCASLALEGRENEDLSCANFKNLYQRQIMGSSSMGIINAPAQIPGQTPGHR